MVEVYKIEQVEALKLISRTLPDLVEAVRELTQEVRLIRKVLEAERATVTPSLSFSENFSLSKFSKKKLR